MTTGEYEHRMVEMDRSGMSTYYVHQAKVLNNLSLTVIAQSLSVISYLNNGEEAV